ncbi:hypothetical protein T11_5390, partial [Trichinella zimbabwensis]
LTKKNLAHTLSQSCLQVFNGLFLLLLLYLVCGFLSLPTGGLQPQASDTSVERSSYFQSTSLFSTAK